MSDYNCLLTCEHVGEIFMSAAEAYEKGRIDSFKEKEGADGCEDCAFSGVEEWVMPCSKCKRNMKDYWRAKATELGD